MLPSLRLMVATFLSAFMLAAISLHFAASSRLSRDGLSTQPILPTSGGVKPGALGTIEWPHAGNPVPMLFDLRFSADLTMIGTIPARLTPPADGADLRPILKIAPDPDPLPVATEPPVVDLPLEPDALLATTPPTDAVAVTAPLTSATVAPAPPIATPKRANQPVAARANAAKPKAKSRLARRTTASKPKRTAAPDPLSNLFGVTP